MLRGATHHDSNGDPQMEAIIKARLGRNSDEAVIGDVEGARAAVHELVAGLVDLALGQAGRKATFLLFETTLIPQVMALARAAVVLFLVASGQRENADLEARLVLGGRTFRRAPPQSRSLLTWFGVVRYQRIYLREVVPPGKKARGFHPLDAALGLLADRVSPGVLAIAVRLATRVSFADARLQLGWFLPTAPSTEVIEAALLGYGRHTPDWFSQVQAPPDDGEVLVIQVDSKGVPTATDEELRRRRGKRANRAKAPSPRHRGRCSRRRRTAKPRRNKGDRAKNARMGTMVVMYTLRRAAGLLLGPINKRYYASFAPKRHAFQLARREATRRGFPPGTKRTVQIVTDGDNDLARYTAEFFPEALHTIDVAHVVEKLWDVGSSLHREGSPEHKTWVETQKTKLYAGRARSIVAELERHLAKIPLTGPGNKFRRKKLSEVRDYMGKRVRNMNYADLRTQDLEIGSGQVEGAIKALMYRRMDQGGMRWIKERAEALLQLRCIDANGDWQAFVDRVHHHARDLATSTGVRVRLQQRSPAPLPTGQLQDAA
jgi:hypothetical protein